MAEFYVETGDIACHRKLVRVSLNGKRISKSTRAKSGKDGFVEFYKQPYQIVGGELVTVKLRGNVKISMSPR
jgi:hypothetical protein